MTNIVNPFLKPYSDKNYPVSWTWADHVAHGYTGGTDYAVPPGHVIRSPAAGTAIDIADGLNGIRVIMSDGRSITIREARTRTGRFPRPVSIGDELGVTGRLGTKYPHIEGETVSGVRIPFEPMVTHTDPAGGGGTPINTYTEDDDMPQHIKVVAGGNPSAVPVGDYILTASGLEGGTALALGLIDKNPNAFIYTCWGEEAAAIDATVRAAFVRNLPAVTVVAKGFTDADRTVLNGINTHTDSAVSNIKVAPTKATVELS